MSYFEIIDQLVDSVLNQNMKRNKRYDTNL